MFRALGDVVHLVQDMGQPQHTRNDRHAGVLGAGATSVYEFYVDARAIGETEYKIDGTTVTPQPLDYGSYPIPSFARYSDYFSTSPGAGSLTGNGLADYSNRGFFSFGTNLGSNSYASPSNDAGSYTRESTTGLIPNRPLRKLTFLRGEVPDTLNAGFNKNIRMTTESVFDLFLVTTPPTYHLNRRNYDDMADLLIPRAVAYSAGLVNYFFRGKLDAVPQGPGTLLVKNLSAEEMKGDFGLYYDDAEGSRRPVTITTCRAGSVDVPVSQGKCSGATLASVSISPNSRLEISFTPPAPPAVPAPKTAGEYMLVFNGSMGEERADTGTIGAVVAKSVTGQSWPFYVTASAKHYFGALSEPIATEISTPLTGSRVISTLGKTRALSRSGTTWKVVTDRREVTALQGGAFDAWGVGEGSGVLGITANPKSLGLVLSGADIRFMDETTNMVVPTRVAGFQHRVFPLLNNFVYGRWSWDFGGSGKVTEFFDLSTGAVAPVGLPNTQVNPAPLSTYYDVVFMEWPTALDTGSMWSMTKGLLGTWTRVGTEHPEAFGFIHPVASSKLNYYSFEIEGRDGANVTIGVTKAIGALGENEVLSYTIGRATTLITDWTITQTLGIGLATQNKAYSGFFKDASTFQVIDDNGVVTTLDTAYPGNFAFVTASTKNHAWWIAEVPGFEAGPPTRIRFYNETGLAHTSAEIDASDSLTFDVVGTTRDHVFVRATYSAFPGVEFIVGSDGTFTTVAGVLPAWVTPVSGTTHLTDSKKLYALRRGSGNDPDDAPDLGVVQTLHHITSNVQGPEDPPLLPAPEVFRYSIPAGIPSATIPVRSAIQDHQEKADW